MYSILIETVFENYHYKLLMYYHYVHKRNATALKYLVCKLTF